MALSRKQETKNNNILMAMEYLANRLTDRHAVYFHGNTENSKGKAQLVIGSNIPTIMEFEGDQLAESLGRILIVAQAALDHGKKANMNVKAQQGLKADIAILQQLLE